MLAETLAHAIKDRSTVSVTGEPLGHLVSGVDIRPLVTHADRRGTVMELIDTRWPGVGDLPSAYTFTIRPGFVKGWNIHRRHQDRYVILSGEVELVLFDPREDSPTYKKISKVVLSAHRRCLVNVPIDVWHADHNIGTTDAVLVNFPTEPYRHDDPDKYRLPIDTPLIPYSFGAGAQGW